MRQGIRASAGVIAAAVLVSAVCLSSALLSLSPAPTFAFLCAAFALLGALGGRAQVLVAVTVGALELALLLPGQGFAVAQPDDALGLVGTVATGLLIAWFTGRTDGYVERLESATDHLTAERDRLSAYFNELSHRISNDLAMLHAFTSCMSRDASEHGTRLALNSVNERIVALGGVHRKLHVDAAGRHRIVASAFIDELCSELQQSTFGFRSIRLDVNVTPVALPLGQMVILGLIVNELITNAYKHAFPDDRAGEVRVLLRHHAFRSGALELIVTDNGIGFDLAGTGDARLGRRLLGSLAAQIGGDLIYARFEGLTEARLVFMPPHLPAATGRVLNG